MASVGIAADFSLQLRFRQGSLQERSKTDITYFQGNEKDLRCKN